MNRPAAMVDEELSGLIRTVLGKVATGPELGRAISREQARDVMAAILAGRVHPVQAGVFLIALRMKRETDEENLGLLDALQAITLQQDVDVETLVDVADPYDGFDRCLPASPFLPAVLAACGLPAVSHGVLDVGPKHGLTTRQVLEAAGVDCDTTLPQARRLLEDPAAGWCYADQQAIAPPLYALLGLRELIVKRPALTTIEKMLCPFRARGCTTVLVGYVHKAYPRIYLLLARAAGFDSAIVLRGVEGGVVPSLRQGAAVHGYPATAGNEDRQWTVEPAGFGIESALRAPALPEGPAPGRAELAALCARSGMATLSGAPGATRDALVYAGGLCLWHNGLADSAPDAAARVREVLDTGAALARFERVKTAAAGPIRNR